VKVQAGLDFLLYFLFFFPGMFALVWYGYEIAADSWRYKEVSFNSPASIQIYFFKSLIPVAGALLLVQGSPNLCAASWQCATVSGRSVWPT
jgi:TRAP-type mannitol/chloroaromatic compound transport system permease small subunit